MTTFNTDLAERVLAQIKDHPETWDQASFHSACGTTYCFAGFALALSGYTVAQQDTTDDDDCWGPDGVKRDIEEAASELLGLPHYGERESALFYGDGLRSDRGRVERLVKHFANNPDDDSLPEDES